MMRSWRNLRNGLAWTLLLALGGTDVFDALASAADRVLYMQGLSQALKAAGWQVARDEDGAVRLFLRAEGDSESDPKPSRQDQPEFPPPSAVVPVDEMFRKQLQQLGWRVVEEPDGSLSFYPPSRSGEPLADNTRAKPALESVAEESKTVTGCQVRGQRP